MCLFIINMCLDSFHVFKVIYLSEVGVQMDPPPPPVPSRLISDEAQIEICLSSIIFRTVIFYCINFF